MKRLRNKLLVSMAAISMVAALASMLAVSWVINQQYLDQAHAFLHKASRVIQDNLNDRISNQLLATRQLATQKNLGSTIWYLSKYAHSNMDREMLFVTYQQLARDIYHLGKVAQLSRTAIYDTNGQLISFALTDKGSAQVGYVEHSPVTSFKVATLSSDEEINRSNLITKSELDKLGFDFGGAIPAHESAHYVDVNGTLGLECLVPIMGETFNPNSGKREMKLLGLLVTLQLLDQSFVDRLSRLTDVQINLYSQQGLSFGDVSDYIKPDFKGAQKIDLQDASSTTILNEIKVGERAYYQSLITLYDHERSVGTISALHSKDHVRQNTLEMMRVLALIAIISLLLVFIFAWYFANTIFQPLTVLSQIFQAIAGGKRSGMVSAEFKVLEKELRREDELGDLAQSFLAMNQAIDQKIAEINQINATLEQTVTERTAALSAREHESRSLIENSPDTIARYDRNLIRTYVNPAFDSLSYGGAGSLLGTRPSEYPGGPSFQNYEEQINEVFLTGKDSQLELKWQGQDGKEIDSHIRLTAERDPTGNIVSVLGIGRNITELNASRTELKRKELAKTRFLAAAGHDLRQPLAAANLFIDALRYSEPTTHQAQIIQRLDQAMSTFNQLLNTLLDISKLDAGIIKPEYTSINISELFIWLEENLQPLAADKKIGFKLYFPIQERLRVHSDIGLLKSVLMNFISNAMKFTSQGGILVSARKRGDEVLFQVWDTGIGIAQENLDQIFDEFFQIDNPQRNRSSGLGLGLSIAKRALSLLDTQVSCRSILGRGSVFGFCQPIDNSSVESTARNASFAATAESDVAAFVHSKAFVILEDDELVGSALLDLLTGMGGKVRLFNNGEDALLQADIGLADYYLVDYMLGGELDGIQFLERLKSKSNNSIVAVLMTGDTSPAFMHVGNASNWPILHKPTAITNVIAALRDQIS